MAMAITSLGMFSVLRLLFLAERLLHDTHFVLFTVFVDDEELALLDGVFHRAVDC